MLAAVTAVAGVLTVAPRPGHAQGATREAATPLARPEFGGAVSERDSDEQFYRFRAGPGEVTVTLDVSNRHGLNEAAVDLYDAAWTRLLTVEQAVSSAGTSERKVATVRLSRPQPVFVRVRRRSYSGVGSFRVRLEGAVAFAAGAPTVAEAATGPAAIGTAASARVLRLPASGTLRLVMRDGSTREIDLTLVRQAGVTP